MRVVLGVLLVLASCVKSQSVQCADWTCPEGTVCDTAHTGCATRDQLTACENLIDGDVCMADVVDDGRCDAGVCMPALCGDGYRAENELCDGDQLSKTNCTELGYYDDVPLRCNDGCSFVESDCTGRCGDGIYQPEHELCDDAPPSQTCVDLGYGAGFLTCSLCGPGLVDCKLFGWDLPKSVPTIVRDLHATSLSDIWIAGGNTVMHHDGVAWTAVSLVGCNVPASSLLSIWATGSDIFAVGDGGLAIHITSGGCTQSNLGSTRVFDVWGAAANDVYALAFAGLFHFNGTAWSPVTLPLFDETAEGAVWASAPNNVWAGKNSLRHFDGSSWSTVTATNLTSVRAIAGTSATDVYVAGYNVSTPTVWHFDGAWTELPQPPGQITTAAVANGRVFVAGVLTTTNNPGFAAVFDGASWIDLDMPLVLQHNPAGLTVLPGGDLFIIADFEKRVFHAHGTFERHQTTPFGSGLAEKLAMRSSAEAYARTSDGDFVLVRTLWQFKGGSWLADTNLPNIEGFGIEPVTGTVFAVNYQGLHARTAETAWTLVTSKITEGLILWPAAADDVWVVTPLALTRWTSGADIPCPSCDVTGVLDLWGSSPSDIFAVGTSGTILHWDGADWSPLPSGTTEQLNAVWGSGANDVYAVGENGALRHFDGIAWGDGSFGASFNIKTVWGSRAGDVFVGTEEGEIFHRDALGRWAPVRSGTTFGIGSISGAGDSVIWFDGNSGIHHLTRTFSW